MIMIDLQINKDCFALGDTIEVNCLWSPLKKDENKDGILGFGWSTAGKGNVDYSFLHITKIQPNKVTNFGCAIPLYAPPSYEGKLIQIIWTVQVNIKSRGIKGFLNIGSYSETKIITVVSKINKLSKY